MCSSVVREVYSTAALEAVQPGAGASGIKPGVAAGQAHDRGKAGPAGKAGANGETMI